MNYIRLGWQQQGKKDVHITTSIILFKHVLKLFLKNKYRGFSEQIYAIYGLILLTGIGHFGYDPGQFSDFI